MTSRTRLVLASILLGLIAWGSSFAPSEASTRDGEQLATISVDAQAIPDFAVKFRTKRYRYRSRNAVLVKTIVVSGDGVAVSTPDVKCGEWGNKKKLCLRVSGPRTKKKRESDSEIRFENVNWVIRRGVEGRIRISLKPDDSALLGRYADYAVPYKGKLALKFWEKGCLDFSTGTGRGAPCPATG